MNKNHLSPNRAAFIAAVAAIVISAYVASTLSPVLASIIRESSAYEANNLMGDVLSVAMMFVIVAGAIIAPLSSKCTALRAERDALRAGRDALRAERDALRAERDALRAERDALRAERDSYVRFTVALDEALQNKSDTITSLENRMKEWANRYYSLRSRMLSK